MVKVLANTHSTFTSLYIHVDDISTLTKASSGKEMVKQATAFACGFAKFARDLKLDISDKTTVVPDNVHTRQFAKNASQLGVPMKVSKEGTDIGVDCSSASKRSTKKQRARAAQTAARAKRTALLAKKNHRVRRLALTGVKPAQTFGHTAVGMAPTTVNKCKSNIAEATGMMGTGACATSVIRWAFRKGKHTNVSADPRVCISYDQVKAWIAMYHRSSPAERRRIHRRWPKKYTKMKEAKSMWQCVRGPIDATIATLIEAKWDPHSPTKWRTPGGLVDTDFNYEEGVSHHRILHVLREGLEADLWKHASGAHLGSGLEDGLPHFGPASTVYDKFVKQGKHVMARALEIIVTNRSWCGSRLLNAGIISEEEAKCKRCGQDTLETPHHRYYTCPANTDIEAKEVTTTQHLHKHFKRDTSHCCMWYRGVLPGSLIAKPVGWIDESNCSAIIMGNFADILDRTRTAGTDGGGDKENNPRNRRVSSRAGVFDPDT